MSKTVTITRVLAAAIFLLHLKLRLGHCGFLDDQPKFLTEDGNFVIESALDRNITFRLLGRSCIKVNDVNIMNLIRPSGNVTLAPNIGRRLRQLELRMNSINLGTSNRGLLNRLTRLENRVRNASADTRFASVIRRLRSVEIRLNTFLDSLNSDNCTSNPCKNGATCLNAINSYLCKCADAWTGDSCEQDVNECAIFAGTDLGCQNGATCTNTFGSYTCTCLPGWVGLHCARRTVDCLASSSVELCGKGACVHTNDAIGYRCICDQGWTTNNVTPACTIDIDECRSPQPHCSMDPEVMCINLPGSYMCGHCPAGYTGNGHYCRDINECEINNGGCSVAPMVTCTNTRGSSRCGICPTGYTGDGRVCVRSSSQWDPLAGTCASCHSMARCVSIGSSAMCICPPMYTGSGYGPSGCTHLNATFDVCAHNPCQNGGTCLNIGILSFSCQCPVGTVRPLCTSANANPCANNPCRNGGTCISSTGNMLRFQCTCPQSHSGALCQNTVRQCGGAINGETGVLKYPLVDNNNYPHNSHCAWLIRTNASLVLNVTFTKFNLEKSHECRFDWLQIHDGRSSSSFVIGRFCGTDFPKGGNIISTQNMLYLWFRSDNSTNNVGFELNWTSIPPVCGGDIEATSHGTISSPGSPGNYPPNRDCIWHVQAPNGKRISLHFFTMQIEEHSTCQYDYLAIYNGPTTDDELLEKFCNTSHPIPLITPSNEITLHFHSDADLNDAGFQIHYSVIEGVPGCGGTYTSDSGQFGAPMQNGAYMHNLLCHYLIRLPKNSHIKIQFQTFALESSSACAFDYLEIYEGSTETAPKVGRWCGNDMPPAYESLGNELLLVFKSDWSSAYDGFTVSYDVVCGGKFEDNNGTIMSPLYPITYKANRKCDYYIEAPMGKAIKLDFSDFDIEDNSGGTCDFDYLEVYDGSVSNTTKLGRYCGESNPGSVSSTMNYLHLLFETDSSVGGRGFKGNYSFEEVGCGGIIKRPGVTITPPLPFAGSGYANDARCSWIIIAPKDHIVQLSFTSFHLESGNDCSYDSLAVYSEYMTAATESENVPPIGKYCGSSLPPVLQSSGNVLALVFRSDDSISGNGFSATYNFVDGRNICGGRLYATTGTITSPGFPRMYQANKDCIWIITARTGQQVELIVKSFELEESSSCDFDFLEIRNGGNEKSSLIGTYCGTDILPRFKSFSNQIYVRFKTDSTREMKGFEIGYDSSSAGCGGVFSNTQRGSITSPNYPEPYETNMQCDWRISVSAGSLVSIIITDMEMEERGTCNFDYLEIFDGADGSARSFGKFCDSDHPLQIESTTNNVFLRMRSDYSMQGRGFDLKFNTNCRREIRDIRGVIETPNYPSFYPHNAKCEWKILPSEGNKLYFEFSSFDLEHLDSDATDPCQFDHVTIEERDSTDSLIRSNKYCDKMPIPFSTSNTVIVKFESDFSNTDRGFHLEFETVGCGGKLMKPEGVFSTPNYPQPYPHNTKCLWSIEVDYGHLIEITFHDFDFEATPGACHPDGLIIANEINSTKPIAQFCGSMHKTPGIVTSMRNKVFASFYSDMSYAGRGFTATYRAVPLKCGGLFSLAKGQITSPNYPNNYEPNSYCEFLLRAEPSHALNLKFTDFDLELTTGCTDDYVQVYDGPEKRADKLLLDRTCGSQMPNDTIRGDTNEMLVIMQSDFHIEAKGFSAEFSTACGAKINTSSSGILEIGHNLRWSVEQCTWTIRAINPNQHVSLSIMHIENEPIFQNYYVQAEGNNNRTLEKCLRKIYIYEGTSRDGPELLEICSSKHPPMVMSSGNALTIILANVSEYENAFAFELKAYYTVFENECGGNFSSISGQLASPGFPRSYPNNIECEWTIGASPGNLMSITIEMLDIDQSDQCNDDYLEIREQNSVGKLLGIFCGQNEPPTLPSANLYWLKFRSNNDGVGLGFKLEYIYAKHVELTGKSGVITSPLYPSFLYSSSDPPYTYRISVAANHVISLVFANDLIFKRETSIYISDGYDEASPLLVEFSNEHLPDRDTPIQSTANTVFIKFRIDTISETKFKINWSEISSDDEQVNTTTNSLNCSANAMVEVSLQEALQLRSPGYPAGYESGLNCRWTFYSALQGYHVSMTFMNVDLENTQNCLADYVRVDSSTDLKNFNNLTTICSPSVSIPRKRYDGAPYLRIEFVSDYYTNRTGFDSFVFLSCGGPLTTPDGEIAKKMLDRDDTLFVLGANRTCEWTVVVRPGRTIQFNFTRLNLMPKTDGSCNSYLIIRNGPTEDAPFLGAGKFCGTDTTISIEKTSSNKAYVQYVSSIMQYPTDDFVLQYHQIEHNCGGYITLTPHSNSTIISTPNYPNIPSAHIECVWRIIAPNGNLMQIEVIDRFDLTPSTNCDIEYLELREGSTAVSPLIGRYCKSIDQKIFTTSNSLRLHYFTDVSVPRNGFKLNVSLAVCGRSITANSGFITSPGYPGLGSYPLNEACEYFITGKAASSLNISFVDLHLPFAENCNETDHIVISSYIRDAFGNITLNELNYVCGTTTLPPPILTGSSRVLIKFITKSQRFDRRGFRIFFNSTTETCGSHIEASSGTIQSPGYPLVKMLPLYCEWFITVPKGRRVKVEILDFDMIDVYNEPYMQQRFVRGNGLRFRLLSQGLTFYNDFNYQTRIRHIGNGNETAEPIKSSDNKMLINAGITEGESHRGFRLRFTSDEATICDGNFDQNEGSFETPASSESSSYYCEFGRRSDLPLSENGIATLSIKIADDVTENGTLPFPLPCYAGAQSGIEFIYHTNERRALLTRCPRKFNNIATPFTGSKLIARSSFFRNRFRFTYKIHNCGSILTPETTITNITQPTLATNYGELDCVWLYGSTTDQRIQLSITSTQFNCENEYINVYNGKSPVAPRTIHVCGDASADRVILISASHVFIEYHADTYNASSRFQVLLSSSDGICGGSVQQPNFIFSSPKNGTKYPSNSHCEWFIKAQSGFHVGLAFVNRFMLEASVNCTKDYVEIYDRIDDEWKWSGRFCGRDLPPIQNSTGTEMKIVFHSDASGDGDGFSIQWTETCGGIFHATNELQYITSPRYPDKYMPSLFCNYTILSNDEQQISLKFLDFDLEDTSRACVYDNVTIYRKELYSYPLLMEQAGVYCWQDSLKVALRLPTRIDIVFRTDRWYEKRGFKFQYSTDQCGGHITHSTYIQSLNDETTNAYVGDVKCTWNITAPSDKRIVIRFEEFDVEGSYDCYSDYVEVYEGLVTTDKNRKARLCGNITQPAIYVQTNKALVRFITDNTMHYKGFRALVLFQKNCDRVVNLTVDNLTYTLNELYTEYEPMLDCHYLFTAPAGYVVQVKFNQLHLAPCAPQTSNDTCACDYLTLRDGSGPFSEPIGTYCGHSNPVDTISSDSALWMRFSTDGAIQSTGFSATMQAVRSFCGQRKRKIVDSNSLIEIESPNDGTTYLPNINCVWEIDTQDNHVVDVKFERFDLQGPDSDGQCSADYLEIRDASLEHHISEGLGENVVYSGSKVSKNVYFYVGKSFPVATHTYCGNSTPMDYISTSKVSIRFKTDESVQKSGFKFTAKSLRDCERNFTRPQGRLVSNRASACEHFISVPENYTISLYFSSFAYSSDTCTSTDAPIIAYDGKTGQQLEKFCAGGLPNPFFSSTNVLKLKFKPQEMYGILYDITYIASNKGRGCGGEVFNYGGTITSPGYPNTDRNDSDCTWIINVPQNLKVGLHFSVFDIGPKRLCDNNFLEIIEPNSDQTPQKFCGTDKISPYKSKTNTVSVRFKSGRDFAGTGWILLFMAVHEEASNLDGYY